jgi:predicted metal-dependent phosphoesterase TrpH
MSGSATCDLHSHTLYSDGALEPEALVELAARNGLAALAVTDHDGVEALPAAMRRGAALGLEVVPGIELSVDEGGLDVHLLGYFVSRPDVLREALDDLRREREVRARRMVERLAALGCPVDFAAVAARARGGVVGRPHVAEELVARGHVESIDAAFELHLGADRPAYVAKRALGLAEAVRLLRAAGAVSVVAHPGPSELDALLPRLRPAGVIGLEVWHPKHDRRDVRRYLAAARTHGLLPTGGSDFHRPLPGGLEPGSVAVPLEVLDALRPFAT